VSKETDVRDVISVRLANILRYGNISTLEQAAKAGPVSLLKLANFGKSSMREIMEAMDKAGFAFDRTKWQRENPTYASLKEDLRKVTAKLDALQARIDTSVTGTVERVGDDEDGQPRVLIFSTRDALLHGPNIACKRVAILVME
jgi:DNA polymerase/3'-5' exonuclease PolX